MLVPGVGGSQFTIEAKRIGKFKLTLKADLEGPTKWADIVIREIEVVPNGRQQTMVFNGRLETSVEHPVTFPPDALPAVGKIFARLYPGPLSQVVASSATYPNVLALDYMTRTKQVTPEVRAKAEGFIANGYQRLLTFEVPGGGFSWFGQAPANKILTLYRLMEFADMAKVDDVDARVIQRTQQWLARQQQPDGSWKRDTNFINEGATNRYNTDRGASAAVETTTLILQALLKSGEAPAVARKALNYIAARKDASGTWGTQATTIALRALLLSTQKSSAEARGTVRITLNGKPAARLTLTQENGDLFRQFVLQDIDFNGSNKVGIDFQGEGSPAYQVAGQYFVPWTAKTSDELLSIEVSYDRTRLSEGDLASATATVKNHLSKTANMVMVDLGILPGFDLLTEVDDYLNKSATQKRPLGEVQSDRDAGHSLLLSIGAGETIALRYRLRAKYPIRTRTFQSRVYQYYEPEVKSVARPVDMEIRKRRDTRGEGNSGHNETTGEMTFPGGAQSQAQRTTRSSFSVQPHESRKKHWNDRNRKPDTVIGHKVGPSIDVIRGEGSAQSRKLAICRLRLGTAPCSPRATIASW